jgi:hypothetical protein
MTTRSKQWYTKASKLPNSFANVSIGSSLDSYLDNKIIGQEPMEIKISNMFG